MTDIKKGVSYKTSVTILCLWELLSSPVFMWEFLSYGRTNSNKGWNKPIHIKVKKTRR